MSLSNSSLDLFSFTQSASFDFYHSGLLRINICPIDQQIKQLNIKINFQGEKQTLEYEEVLEHSDFFGIPKSHKKENLILSSLQNTNFSENQSSKLIKTKNNDNFHYESESLLWFKLYLEEYLRKVQTKLGLNKSQRQANHIFNSFFIFTEEVYMRKVYKDAEKILRTLQQDNNNFHQQASKTQKAVNKSLLLKIDPSILNYPGGIFQKPFVINFPRKLKPEQVIISTVELNSYRRQLVQKGIQNIFFDNKYQ